MCFFANFYAPFEEESACSVDPSVTFLFPINNSRVTYLPHTWSTHSSWVAEVPYWFWFKGQGHQDQMCQTVSDCFSNNFLKWISSSYMCATCFELTYPVVQNICDKKSSLECTMFYKHLLFVYILNILFVYILNIICKITPKLEPLC